MPNTPKLKILMPAALALIPSLPLIFNRIIKWFKLQQTQFALIVFARTSAAVLAGYVTAATLACLLTQVLPMPRFESTLTANMLAFLFYVIAIFYAFCVRKTWHAWRDLTLFSLLCFALLKVCGQ